MRDDTKSRDIVFRFNDAIIQYSNNTLYTYFLTDNHEKNKEINELLKDIWYIRIRLSKSVWLVEIALWIEYKWCWKYCKIEHIEQIKKEKDKRKKIRKAPII